MLFILIVATIQKKVGFWFSWLEETKDLDLESLDLSVVHLGQVPSPVFIVGSLSKLMWDHSAPQTCPSGLLTCRSLMSPTWLPPTPCLCPDAPCCLSNSYIFLQKPLCSFEAVFGAENGSSHTRFPNIITFFFFWLWTWKKDWPHIRCDSGTRWSSTEQC